MFDLADALERSWGLLKIPNPSLKVTVVEKANIVATIINLGLIGEITKQMDRFECTILKIDMSYFVKYNPD